VKVFQNDRTSILFGCPPEIIKTLMRRGIALPEFIVLPDTIERFGVLQNATEFPLYLFLFVQGNFQRNKKITIIGEAEELRRNRELLSLTLLGPSEKEYEALGDSPVYQDLYRESRALSVKDGTGKEIPIDGFVNFLPFKEGLVEHADFTLRHEAANVYSVGSTVVDINFLEKQSVVYDLRPDFVPITPARFGIDVLGGASGFSAEKPCSGLVLNYNADLMLIDCMPYIDQALHARGMATTQIRSIFLTHIHDDHCNIFPLILTNDKLQFLGTREIFWMACRKLSLMTGHSVQEFESYFDFVELKADEDNDFLGMTIRPHYTVHSIPTIGATFSMQVGGRERSIVFVGDNKSLVEIEKLTHQGIVKQEKYQRLLELYRNPYDVLIADGGQGILHGDPRDSLGSRAGRVVFVHLEKLPEEFDTTFSLASHGKRFTLQESNDSAFIIKTMQILQRHYPGISEHWETTLLSNVHLVKYNAGDVIMKQGEPSNGLMYVILSGLVSVRYHDGQKLREVTVKEAGDLIGEMAVVKQAAIRSASIVARTPVTLGEISEELFYRFLLAEKRIDEIKRMWSIRQELEVNYPFSTLSDLLNMQLARRGERIDLTADQEVIRQGSLTADFYILLKGVCRVERDGEAVNDLHAGAMFGEWGSLGGQLRNASVIAKGPGAVLRLAADSIQSIIDDSPALSYHVNQLLRERSGQASATQDVARQHEQLRSALSLRELRDGW